MQAWKLMQNGVMHLDDIEAQAVGDSCVKIKITETALSRNDKCVFEGKIPATFPIILGETCVGVVSETGENVKRLSRGNKVLAVPKTGCHECAACLAGKPSECTKPYTFGVDANGFLREFAVLNVADLYLLPDRVSSSEALYVDYINIAISAILKLNLDKGAHIAVIGATDIGIIFAQTAIYYQMVPILIDSDQARLELAESLGIYYTINSSSSAPFKKIFTITGGKLADGIVYAVSSDMPFQPSFEYIKRGGVCAIVGDGYYEKCISGDFSALVEHGISVVGISVDMKNAAGAINILANKSISVTPLINEPVAFKDVGTLFESSAFDNLKDAKIIIKNN